MKIFAFKLSMPGNNSWDGKWSGAGNNYIRFVSMTNARLEETGLEDGSYGYNFGDGWFARVDVFEVTSEEKRKLGRNSKGFAGYDWMIDSIIENGEIISSDD